MTSSWLENLLESIIKPPMDILQLIIDNTLKYPLLDVLDYLVYLRPSLFLLSLLHFFIFGKWNSTILEEAYWKYMGCKKSIQMGKVTKATGKHSESTGNMLYKKL